MIRKRTTLTTTERKQRLFCLLFGSVLLGAALGIVMLRWQYDGVPTSWACFLGMFLEKRSSLAALWLGSIGNILLFLMTFFLLGFSAVGQPFVWLLLLTYGVCMGGALQMQCGSGNVLVRSVLLLIYFVPVSRWHRGSPCGSLENSLIMDFGTNQQIRCATSCECTVPVLSYCWCCWYCIRCYIVRCFMQLKCSTA